MNQEVVAQISQVLESVLEWSKAHPGATLRQLEEEVAKAISQVRAQLLEAAVAQQGVGQFPQEPCACGGNWVFQGYREREVMTTQGRVKVRRAYFTCDCCGAGIFPPGPAVADDGGME
ncbi:MAG: hypothetical protein RML46_00060 [Anaerolineae bacterium]|nr:hypothetical protein [Anaerolineae bacterium]